MIKIKKFESHVFQYGKMIGAEGWYCDENGNKCCFVNGVLDSIDDEPALIYANGNKYWYKKGVVHRENGPAILWNNEDQEWYKDGKLHRKDGPAKEYTDGTGFWYENGKLHREDGPAIFHPKGKEEDQEWWLKGVQYTKEAFDAFLLSKQLVKTDKSKKFVL